MRKITIMLLLPLAAMLFSSCGAWYFAKPADVPLLEGKGDLRASASISTIDILPGAVNAALSYGFTDHFGGQLFGAWYSEGEYYSHLALGYYTDLSDHFVLEVFGGAGLGSSMNAAARNPENLNEDYNSAVWFDYKQVFGQLDLGWHSLPFLNTDIGVGLRGGIMPYTLNVTDKEGKPIYDNEEGVLPLFEPVAFLRFGFENVKLQLSLAYSSLDLYRETLHNQVNCSPFSVSLGISLNL